MSDEPDSDRRTAVRTIGTVCLGALAVPAVASARPAADGDRNERDDRPTRPANADVEGSDTVVDPSRTGVYVGAVDRIVDGKHVVILLEDGDEVVDEAIVPHEEWPFLEEGSIVRVVLLDGVVLAIHLLEERPGERAG